MNSTIINKKKNLICGHFDYNFSKGRCRQCATQQSTKARIEKHQEQEELIKPVGGAELKRWFQERRKEMTGKCAHCGGKSMKHDDKKFHYSIAHILPKAYFKSVATHPDNWIELCFYGNSCHTNYDNHMLDLMDLNCFSDVLDKFVKMYPKIASNERRRIPNILLEYLKIDS